jgi:hypothetical protein
MSSTLRLKARSIDATAMAELKGGTRSCSLANSSAISGASKSRRVDNTWPNFTKIGPKRSSADVGAAVDRAIVAAMAIVLAVLALATFAEYD